MKRISYKLLSSRTNNGTEENPRWGNTFIPIEMTWSKQNEEIAKREAYNGEYEIFDNGLPDPIHVPTDKERLEALEAALLEMMGVHIND